MRYRWDAGRLLKILALAAAYFIAGRLGLSLKIAHGSATPVWAPTGISLAALLMFGRELWPGVALGAFLVNITTPTPPVFSAVAAAGNTLAVLVAFALIRRGGGVQTLERGDQVTQLVIASLVAPLVSATIGAGGLWATHGVPWSDVDFTWLVWWLGDSLGFIIVTPLLLTWLRPLRGFRAPAEAAGLALLIVAAGLLVIGPWSIPLFHGQPLAYAMLPLVAWAALRFEQHGATLATFVVSTLALWGSMEGYGPLAHATQAEVLLLWQVFSMVVAVTALAIAGTASERNRAERALRAREESVRFLAEAGEVLAGSLDPGQTLGSVAELASRSLADWVVVDLLDEQGHLQRVKVAHRDPAKLAWAAELEKRYPPDPNAPGGARDVIASGRPVCRTDIAEDELRRSARDPQHLELLRSLGLHSYMVVPIVSRERALGALSFISAESGRRYGPADLALAGELARRAGLALENARLYSQAVRAEEELRRHSAQLEQRVVERTAELREQHDQMVRFTYTISHDLRAPLRAIHGYVDALAEEGGGGPEYVDRIREATRRMDVLIQDLLAYSRLAKVELAHEPLPVGGIVGEALTQLAPEFERRQAQVRDEVGDHLPAVLGHRSTLVQALVNLLLNACVFVPPGRRPAITVRAEQRADRVRLWVEDNGIGIDPKHHARIFEVFERLHPDGAYAGTGIGLAMVKRAVERMGGEVGVESVLGEGSRFWVELRAADSGD
jgi:signal transduction histidine kinase/integral membrane sensor domain MASE1